MGHFFVFSGRFFNGHVTVPLHKVTNLANHVDFWQTIAMLLTITSNGLCISRKRWSKLAKSAQPSSYVYGQLKVPFTYIWSLS